MSKIKIATDSTADIPKSFCEELNISVLPLTILAGEKEYRDGVDITPSEFYRIIDESKELPVSSQVSTVLYSNLFEKTWKEGYTDLIQVTLNSKGSGTYQAAVLSRNLFFEEHSRPVFATLDLRCVKKSGRISPAAAFLGEAVGLKPIITFEDGDAKIIDKARGERKTIFALVERCMKERRPDTNYAIVYGYNTKALEDMREACAQIMDKPPIAEYQVGCVISINTGPNMIGILYRT